MSSTRNGFILAILGALLAVGCGGSSGGSGGGGGPSDPGPEAKLSIAYTALSAKVGDTVLLTAHLENATSAVAWSLSGPGALSATTGDQIAYDAKAVGQAAVTASAAGLTAKVTLNVLPCEGGETGEGGESTAITVRGLVLNVKGYPVVNQAVFVLGSSGTATSTDGTGHFTIADVTPPYDLGMVQDASNTVYVYRGLTRADPTLYVNTQDDQTNWLPRATTITGDTVGGDPAPGVGELQAVGFFSRDVNRTLNLFDQSSTLPAIPGPYTLDVAWNGPLTTTGTLVGMQTHVDPVTRAPVAYWYAAQPNVTIIGGQPTFVGPTLAFENVESANTEGDITLAPDYVLDLKFLALSFEHGVFFPVYEDTFSLAQPSFKYVAPDIAHANSQVCAVARNTVPDLPGFSATCLDALAPESRGATLAILAAPQPFRPLNTANAVTTSTTFSWSPFTGGVYAVVVVPESASNPTFYIFTAGTSTTIPNLPEVGEAFGNGAYTWRVTGYAPFDDLDAFTSGIPAAATAFLNNGIPPPVPNAATGTGQEYSFTKI